MHFISANRSQDYDGIKLTCDTCAYHINGAWTIAILLTTTTLASSP